MNESNTIWALVLSERLYSSVYSRVFGMEETEGPGLVKTFLLVNGFLKLAAPHKQFSQMFNKNIAQVTEAEVHSCCLAWIQWYFCQLKALCLSLCHQHSLADHKSFRCEFTQH